MGQDSGALGPVTDWTFGKRGPQAAQDAAMEQRAEAQRQYGEQKDIYDKATTAGLLNYDKALAQQDKNIGRQEQLISQIDPTIIEASQQALKLLRGEQSSTLAPIQQQRQVQRQKLLDQLRQQLGPGAETSTAGIQALNNFDMQTNSLLSQQQQSAIQTLGGVGQQWNSVRPDMTKDNMAYAQLGQGRADLQFNQAAGLRAAGAPLIGTAGADRVFDTLQGQQQAQRTNAWLDSSLRFGEAFGGFGMGKSGGGSTSTPVNYSGGGRQYPQPMR